MERLKTEVPALKWIAEDIGQLDIENPPVSFPCALISYTNSTYEELGNMNQGGLVTINIRLAFNAHADTYAVAPESHLDASLERFEVENNVYKALHGWGDEDGFQGLSRVSSASERRADGMKVRELQFTTYYIDGSAVPVYTAQAVSLNVNGGIID